MSFALSRRIRLVNVFALLASGTTVPYIFTFFGHNVFLGWLVLFFVLCLVSTWFWNKSGRYDIAKLSLYVFSYLYLFTAASALGKESGEHMIMIPVLFSAVLLFEFKEKLSLAFVVLLTLTALLLLEFTSYSIFSLELTPKEQQHYYFGSLAVTMIGSISVSAIYFVEYGKQLNENRLMLATSKEIEHTINYFSTSLFGTNSVDEILWDVAKNCIGRLGFADCVIYLLDEKRGVLSQKAAYGAKNPNDFEIYEPIEIALGTGIVGNVAQTGQPIIVHDTSKDPRYIADDRQRFSEIAVPLIYNNKVIGVIDSEHPEKGFFTERHLSVMKTISSLCANKVARALADEEKEKALKLSFEAEKIKAFDELKSKLFANVSHELRTPLTLIMGTINKHSNAENSADWGLLKKYTDRLLRLINQLLDLTKLEAGQFKLHPLPADVMGFLRLNLSLFSSLAHDRQITLINKIPPSALWLSFDRDALEKILFNLLSNAIKFTKNHSAVTLSASYDQELVFSVSDQGDGISEKDKQKIFDRFYQAGKNKSSGTGIGLALTKELIELQRGSITVDSKLGHGTTFIVRLPLDRAQIPEDKPVLNMPAPVLKEQPDENIDKNTTDAESILVVEDNQELATFIKGELDPDFNVYLSFDGDQGVREAQKQLPDLIISDVMMPKVDGFELCQLLKENVLTSHIPIILLTARADFESKLTGLQTGADDYLVKPFNSEELNARIKNLLAQRQKLKDKFSRIISLDHNDIVITSVDEVFIKKVMGVVESHIDDSDFSVTQLCGEIGISRMQLHRKLTTLTGHSTTSFIRNHRLVRASKLLEAGEPVSQVAYAVGFQSLSYFTRAFRARFGIAPSEHALQNL